MEIKIDDIIVKNRIRKNTGDIQPLMDSMSRFGQFSSIVVNSKMQLIAGFRRLDAAKKLGWKTINAVVIDSPGKGDVLEIEIEENMQRKDLSADEISDAYKKLSKIRSRNIFTKILNFLSSLINRIVFKIRKNKKNRF